MIEKYIKKEGTQTWILNSEWIKKNYPDTINIIKKEIFDDINKLEVEDLNWFSIGGIEHKHLNTNNTEKLNLPNVEMKIEDVEKLDKLHKKISKEEGENGD